MALSITHTKVSAIADDPAASAAGEILPSDWNAALSTSMATGAILGRASAGAGAIEELTSAQVLALLGNGSFVQLGSAYQFGGF